MLSAARMVAIAVTRCKPTVMAGIILSFVVASASAATVSVPTTFGNAAISYSAATL